MLGVCMYCTNAKPCITVYREIQGREMQNIETGGQISMVSELGVTRSARSEWGHGQEGNRGGDKEWSKEEEERT